MSRKQAKLTSFFTKTPTAPRAATAHKQNPGAGVVGCRIKVYWCEARWHLAPWLWLTWRRYRSGDDKWYEGAVESFDEAKGKHRVTYDDGDVSARFRMAWAHGALQVEQLDLRNEKYEIIGGMSAEQKQRAERNREEALRRREARCGVLSAKRAKVAENEAVTETPAPRKRRVVLVEDDDEEDEQGSVPGKRRAKTRSFDASAFRTLFKMTPAQSRRDEPAAVSSTSSRESEESTTPIAVAQLVSGECAVGEAGKGSVFPVGAHLHDTNPAYAFLTRDRRDASGKRPDEPGFDPKTLKIPNQFFKDLKMSEVQKQWWHVKSTHADSVLFFKIGRFYELYHDDADVGVREAGLVYMKGEQAHAGFPEPAYGKYAEVLLAKGYKVARVEQTETPEANKQRIKRAKESGKYLDQAAKAMRREVCSLTTPGTRLYTYLDDQDAVVTNDGPLCAVVFDSDHRYGVCLLDAPTGSFALAEFDDDAQRSRLRTLISDRQPVEFVLPCAQAEAASQEYVQLRDVVTRAARRVRPNQHIPVEPLYDGWDFDRTVRELAAILPRASKQQHNTARWPRVLREAVDGRAELALRALGGVTFWLRRCLVDVELLTMGNFDAYAPDDPTQSQDERVKIPRRLSCDEAELARGEAAVRREDAARRFDDADNDDDDEEIAASSSRRLTLDATTLKNLEILQSGATDGKSGSLWKLINHAKTAPGSRKLKSWLSRPLLEVEDICARANAVELLVGRREEAEQVRTQLTKVPDLERLLQQLHTLGSARRAPTTPGEPDDFERHPDSRAVLFDAVKLNARKVQQLCKALAGLRHCERLVNDARGLLSDDDHVEGLLARCMSAFPELGPHLDQFESGFDLDRAQRDGTLETHPGADDAYDAAKQEEVSISKTLEEWLMTKKREMRCSDLSYVMTARDRYNLRLPEDLVSRSSFHIPVGWMQKSKSRKFVSFSVPEVVDIVKRLEVAEKRVQAAKVDQLRSLFAAFDARRRRWALAVDCVATLDALLALAHVSRADGFCRPRIVHSEYPVLRVKNGAHPCLETSLGSRPDAQVVGNDLELGGDKSPAVLLLTGPNMGGKSTLLRHVCVSTVLAQMGSYVRADDFELTPVDRIFTRLGASDKILEGQSTFMVELLETASVLKHATPRSLCILDELGRGTATFDGCAIAHCVVDHLVANVLGCRALFATHYHNLVKAWAAHPAVQLGHMDCIVESDVKCVFLYKVVPGLSPRSFGINVARMAHLPQAVIDMARHKSADFERKCSSYDSKT